MQGSAEVWSQLGNNHSPGAAQLKGRRTNACQTPSGSQTEQSETSHFVLILITNFVSSYFKGVCLRLREIMGFVLNHRVRECVNMALNPGTCL